MGPRPPVCGASGHGVASREAFFLPGQGPCATVREQGHQARRLCVVHATVASNRVSCPTAWRACPVMSYKKGYVIHYCKP